MHRSLFPCLRSIAFCFVALLLLLPVACAEEPVSAFGGYVASLFREEAIISRGIEPAGSRLTGGTAVMYNKLVPEILKIAAGERESTVINVPLEDIPVNTTFTADELGVTDISALLDGDKITKAGEDAIDEHLYEAVNDSKLINALLNDYPYELYWYDSSAGFCCDTDWTHTANLTENTITVEGHYFSTFLVSEGYRKDGQDRVMNSSEAQRAIRSAENAKNIVREFEALDDYAKLKAYKDRICELVSYNFDAADDDKGIPYGDPYQLVWVFDGDPTTNVICEGYAKAFKYLCDLSTFNGDVSAITILGQAGEPHMWNNVSMNGINYLVDVTNCDEDTIGYPNKLFMAKAVDGSVEKGYRFLVDEEIGQVKSYAYFEDTADSYDYKDLVYAIEYVCRLPDDTASVGNEAFCGAEKLTKVICPAACSSIGNRAFADCVGLTDITIPNGNCTIAESAFENTALHTICTTADSAVASWALAHGIFVDPLE